MVYKKTWLHQAQVPVIGHVALLVTDYYSYANRLWTVGSGNVTGIYYGTCDTCVVSVAG